MEDREFVNAVQAHPKLFTGFSDTTVNHLMFYRLGLSTYYGPDFSRAAAGTDRISHKEERGYGEESYHFFIKQLTYNVQISRI